MSATAAAGKVCSRCACAPAVRRELCAECYEIVNPTAAVQERLLAVLDYMAQRGLVHEGERAVLRVEFENRAGRVSGYGLTLTGREGRLAYRQGFGR